MKIIKKYPMWSSNLEEMPKSAIFTPYKLFFYFNRIFSNFKSRWIIPSEWIYYKASKSYFNIILFSQSVILIFYFFLSSINSFKFPPKKNKIPVI